MTFIEYASLVRYYTGTNATTFPDADILLLSNTFITPLSEAVVKFVGEDFFGGKFYRDLNVSVREYKLPSELRKIKYLQVNLGSGFKKLTETDLITYGGAITEDEVESHFSDETPEYDIYNNTIYILSGSPIITVTDGLFLWGIVLPSKFTDLTSTDDLSTPPDDYSVGFPEQLHELLARRVSIAYKTSSDRNLTLNDNELNFDKDMKEALITMRSLNLDREVTRNIVNRKDGSEF